MDDQMYFIYSLSFAGNVFYIGKTKDLANRYRWHIYNKCNSQLSQHIQTLIANNNYPEMRICNYLKANDAAKRERDLIRLFSQLGQRLYNIYGLWYAAWEWDKMHCQPDLKRMTKFLEYYQGIKKYYHCFHNKLELPECPPNPFK